MNQLIAQEPERDIESWTQKYRYIRWLHVDTYDILKGRLSDNTIAILDADEDLLGYIEDAKSKDSEDLRCLRGTCYGAHSIMSQFYRSRLRIEGYWDLPDTAVRHILVWGDTYFELSPCIDCVGDVVWWVLKELYDLLDNEHPEKKIEFALQPTSSQKK